MGKVIPFRRPGENPEKPNTSDDGQKDFVAPDSSVASKFDRVYENFERLENILGAAYNLGPLAEFKQNLEALQAKAGHYSRHMADYAFLNEWTLEELTDAFNASSRNLWFQKPGYYIILYKKILDKLKERLQDKPD